jgi:hypothetical protein
VIDVTFLNAAIISHSIYSVTLWHASNQRWLNTTSAVFLTIANNIMNERRFILSQQNNMIAMTVHMQKNVIVRLVEFFTERFDTITKFVAKWTF